MRLYVLEMTDAEKIDVLLDELNNPHEWTNILKPWAIRRMEIIQGLKHLGFVVNGE